MRIVSIMEGDTPKLRSCFERMLFTRSSSARSAAPNDEDGGGAAADDMSELLLLLLSLVLLMVIDVEPEDVAAAMAGICAVAAAVARTVQTRKWHGKFYVFLEKKF